MGPKQSGETMLRNGLINLYELSGEKRRCQRGGGRGEIGNPIITTDKKNVVNERIKENEFKLRIQF